MKLSKLLTTSPLSPLLAGSLLCAATILSATGAPARADEPGYTLNPGDVLQITVWKEDGLDREVLVLPDGSVSFPLVGSLPAKGRTPAQLQADLKSRIEPLVHDAYVTVAVKAALGFNVDVLGQVNKPGELILSHRTSVTQALSMAGGLTPYASHSSIIVIRQDAQGNKTAIDFPYDDISSGQSLDKDIELKAGDVVMVPTASLNPF
jgi:polysaccharide export outer membrane protein